MYTHFQIMTNKNNTRKKLDQLKDILDGQTPVQDYSTIHQLQAIDTEELNDKQLAFALEFTKDRNATQAALRAGYAESSARQYGCKLKDNPAVRAEINRIYTELALENGITLNFQLEKLLNQVNKIERLMDESFDVDTYNSLTKTWLLIMKEINQICGLYNISITNYNIEVPLFPDVKPDSNIEDAEII